MSERSALYLTIARRCAAQGETGRAIVTIINALKNNPQFLESQPESIDFLAEIMIPGFEEEVHRLEACYPSFGYKFYEALAKHGKSAFARDLEQSFSAYCVERLKMVQSRENLPYIASVPESAPAPNPTPDYRQTVAESGFFKASSREHFFSQTSYQNMPQESIQPAPVTPDAPSMPSLPKEVWMPSIQESLNSNSQLTYEKHEFASRNMDSCSSDGIRRFDRIRTQHTLEVTAEDYADTAADRVILDFDNRIRETPKAAMFAATQTKFRSFAEDLAQWREESKTEPKRQILSPVQNPMEIVAETTHALSETPSVEPYTVRHPMRFQLSPQNIVTCVFVCLLGILGLITWHTAEPALEKRAIEGVSSTYLIAADSGNPNPIEVLDNANDRFVDEQWLASYRQFLSVWQNIYYNGSEPPIPSPDSEDFLHEFSASHAAYITQEIALGRYERARMHFESVPSSVWRDHPYFKTWSMGQLDIAAHDYRTAAIQFEKLLRTPLAPFALVELGLLSLEEAPVKADIQQRFLQAISHSSPEMIPALASCTHDIISRHQSLPPSPHEAGSLKSPYAEYCSIGHIFRAIAQNGLISTSEIEQLEHASPLEHGEAYRLEAIIEAELYLHHPKSAVQFYQTLDLADGHPLKSRLLESILSKTLTLGHWSNLHALNGDVPENISYLAAARIIDEAHETGKIEPAGKRSESLLKYRAPNPPAAIDSLMDEAYVEAESGNTSRALNLTRSILTSHPEYVEPLYLQAWILSQMGNAQDAAFILEQNMAGYTGSAPLIVLSNLYRVRYGLSLNPSAYLLRFMHFEDPVLESDRCEILWRRNKQEAQSCLSSFAKNKDQQLTKSVWIMTHLDEEDMPMATSEEWAKAGTGMLSFPGYHLAYGRKLLQENNFQAATRAYTKAILNDFTTSNRTVIDEFAHIYSSRQRRYEGTKKFEDLISVAEKDHRYALILGDLHIAAAHLYQPENGHSTARQHLGRALELLGDRPEILQGMVQYYEAKDKPDQARTWRIRLHHALNP